MLAAQSCPILCDPMDCSLPGSFVFRDSPLSMGFSRQEDWTGLPFPPPGDLPDSGVEPRSPALQPDSLPCEPLGNRFPYSGNMSKIMEDLVFCD